MSSRLSAPQLAALELLEAQPGGRARWSWLLVRVRWSSVRSLARLGLVRFRGAYVERRPR